MESFSYVGRKEITQKSQLSFDNFTRIATNSGQEEIINIEAYFKVMNEIPNLEMLNMQSLWVAFKIAANSNGVKYSLSENSAIFIDEGLQSSTLGYARPLFPLKAKERTITQNPEKTEALKTRIYAQVVMYLRLIDNAQDSLRKKGEVVEF